MSYADACNLFYPENQNQDELRITSNYLFHKFRFAIADDQETVSILNQALGKAMTSFKIGKGCKFNNYYSLIAKRLLMNAVRQRNALHRIKVTESINLFDEEYIERSYFVKSNSISEYLDISYLTPKEKAVIDLYYSGHSHEEIALKIDGVKEARRVPSLIKKAVKKIREHYKAKGERVGETNDGIFYNNTSKINTPYKQGKARDAILCFIVANHEGKTRYEIADELRIGIDVVSNNLKVLESTGQITKTSDFYHATDNNIIYNYEAPLDMSDNEQDVDLVERHKPTKVKKEKPPKIPRITLQKRVVESIKTEAKSRAEIAAGIGTSNERAGKLIYHLKRKGLVTDGAKSHTFIATTLFADAV